MKYALRNGERFDIDSSQDKLLHSLYTSICGRVLMKIATNRFFSKIGGFLLSRKFSKRFIKSFVENNNIDLSIYEKDTFTSYNDFFTRKIKMEYRPIDMENTHFISPCDAKLSVSPIKETGLFYIKNSIYTVNSLLQNTELAQHFIDGVACVFRLTVDDYHRYCYIADATKTKNVHIKGKLHTVNPIANEVYPIYKENSREYTILKTDNLGDILIMEVGALMVGKINNNELNEAQVKRGEEKGYFEFGGSTIIVLTQKDKIKIDKDIIKNSRDGYETKVKMGEKIGISLN